MAHNFLGIPQWTLADRLRKIRRDRHLTQEQMADALGIKAVTWSAWESGRTRPHDVVELAGHIERVFGVPAAWTLGVLTSPPTNTSGDGIPAQRRGYKTPPVPPTDKPYRRRRDDWFQLQPAMS